jgi:chitinase
MRLDSVRLVLFAALILLCAQICAQAHTVSLSWTASTDSVAGYFVYRFAGACPTSGTSGFTKITTTAVTGTSYADSTVAAGAYCYYATSVLNGVESAPSNFASAVILPAAPTSLSVTGTN